MRGSEEANTVRLPKRSAHGDDKALLGRCLYNVWDLMSRRLKDVKLNASESNALPTLKQDTIRNLSSIFVFSFHGIERFLLSKKL